MTWLHHEWRLLWRSRLALASLLLLLTLSVLAVVSGLSEVTRQQRAIAHVAELQQQELATQQAKHVSKGDAGSVAYYTFLGTWDEPSPSAFLALGLRDTAPYVLRVRAHQQLGRAARADRDGDPELVARQLRGADGAEIEVRLVDDEAQVLQGCDDRAQGLFDVGGVESPLLVTAQLHRALAGFHDSLGGRGTASARGQEDGGAHAQHDTGGPVHTCCSSRKMAFDSFSKNAR